MLVADAEAGAKEKLEGGLLDKINALQEEQRLQAEKDKEARVELLRRQIARRMMNQGLVRGWTAWHERWSAKVYALNRLRQVANRLKSPAMAIAFEEWQSQWQEIVDERERARVAGEVDALNDSRTNLQKTLDTLREEFERKLVAAEEEKRVALERLRVELTGTAAEKEKMIEQQQREERIELVRRQMVRRIMNRDISLGFTAWQEVWQAKVYAMKRLRECANRLKSPDLLLAFEFWAEDAMAAKTASALSAQDRQLAAMQAERDEIAEELQRVRSELKHQRATNEEEKRVALERLRVELSGSAAEQAKLQEEQAREERIELLRRQMVRRIMNRDISLGFTAWHELWSAKVLRDGRLRECANRLKAPALSVCFDFWQSDWRAEMQAKLLAEQSEQAGKLASKEERTKRLEKELEKAQAQLTEVEAEATQLREKLSALTQGSAEAERAKEEQLAQEKEARIELLRRQMLRRIMNRDLSMGWVAWHDRWAAKVYSLNKLREVANKLRSPQLAFAFERWAELWGAIMAKRETAQEQLKEAERAEELAAHQRELDAQRAVYEEKLQAAEKAQEQALERLRIELTGTAAEKERMMEEKEREERIELVRRQMVRRIMNRDISLGFTAWQEVWQAKVYAMARLRECANRLKSPDLLLAFEFWVAETERAKLDAEREDSRKKLMLTEARLSHSHHEIGQLKLIHEAHADEIRALKERLSATTATLTTKESNVSELKPLTEAQAKQIQELQESLKEAKEIREYAEKHLEESQAQMAQQRTENKDLIAKLLAEQRTSLENEMESTKTQLSEVQQLKDALDTELASVKTDLASALERKAALEEGQAKLSLELSASQAETQSTIEAKTMVEQEVKRLEGEVRKLNKEIEKLTPKKPSTPVVKESPMKKAMREAAAAEPNLTIAEQLARALRANSSRVMDLFRQWDTDGDGEVSRLEFHKAMPALGLDVPAEDIDALFDEWDADGGGSLEYKELSKILNSAQMTSKSKMKKVGGAAAAATALASKGK